MGCLLRARNARRFCHSRQPLIGRKSGLNFVCSPDSAYRRISEVEEQITSEELSLILSSLAMHSSLDALPP